MGHPVLFEQFSDKFCLNFLPLNLPPPPHSLGAPLLPITKKSYWQLLGINALKLTDGFHQIVSMENNKWIALSLYNYLASHDLILPTVSQSALKCE